MSEPPTPLTPDVVLDVIARAGALFFRWDPFFGLTYLSPTVRDILGYEPAELLGDPALVARVVDPEFLPQLDKLMAGFYVATGEAARVEIPFRTRAGGRVRLETRIVPELGENGAIQGFFGIALHARGAGSNRPAALE